MSKVKVIVFGDKAKCSACKSFAKIESNVAGMLGDKGIGYEFLDYGTNPKGYAAGKKLIGKASIPKYPALFVLNGSKVVGTFVARSMTAAMIVKKVTSLCVDCGEPTDEPVLYKECPTCKGAGKIAIALACLLTLFGAGCVITKGNYTPPPVADVKQPTVSFLRCAVLYPFAVEDVTLPGGVGFGKYQTSGGAAELVPLFDSTGKVIGSVVGTAAKAAVIP